MAVTTSSSEFYARGAPGCVESTADGGGGGNVRRGRVKTRGMNTRSPRTCSEITR